MVVYSRFLAIVWCFVSCDKSFVGGLEKTSCAFVFECFESGIPPQSAFVAFFGNPRLKELVLHQPEPSEISTREPTQCSDNVVSGSTLTGRTIHALCIKIASLTSSQRFWRNESSCLLRLSISYFQNPIISPSPCFADLLPFVAAFRHTFSLTDGVEILLLLVSH
jgi:hypothetical protein